MKRNTIYSNKGYSLVELVIVLSIVLILSVMALVSITILNSAKAKDAAIVVGEEVNVIKNKCMNMSPDTINTSTGLPDGKYDAWALAIYQNNDHCFVVQQVRHDTTTGEFVAVDGEEPIVLSKRVAVKFAGNYITNTSTGLKYGRKFNSTTGAEETNYEIKSDPFEPQVSSIPVVDDSDVVLISFDNRGNCISGFGDGLQFYKKSGNTIGNQVARVSIKKNGSITIK